MAQRDATPAQLAKLKAIRKEFPSARKRGYHTPAAHTTSMRIVPDAGSTRALVVRPGRADGKQGATRGVAVDGTGARARVCVYRVGERAPGGAITHNTREGEHGIRKYQADRP